ncbi:MAG: ABC transporter substrate-binding protein [Chloroflexi bacterium]|nr:ABC transporter substrate-binding protein [Chloroflexota bacterium]
MKPSHARRAAWLRAIPLLPALLMAGCGTSAPVAQPADQQAEEKPQYGGVLLNTFATADPASFDIHLESQQVVWRMFSAAFDNLVRYDPKDPETLIGDLAEKWEFSSDGKTVTFTLRKGAKFHNGEAFSSADAKFTLDRMRGAITSGPGKFGAPRQGLYTAIDSTEAPEPTTFVVRLKTPSASLVSNLASANSGIYSKTWVEAGHDPRKELNATGPFKLKAYNVGVSVELAKNDQYWNSGRPYMDGVRTLIVPDPNTQMAALRTGQVHLHVPTLPQLESLQKELAAGGELSDKITLVPSLQGTASVGWYINTKAKPFDDVRVRQALSLAVDRWEVAKLQNGPDAVPGTYAVTGSFWQLPRDELAKMPGFGPDAAANRAQARKLLADAGYPNGLTFKLTLRNQPSYIDDAVILGDQLKKAGINMEPVLVDNAEGYRLAEKHDFQVASVGSLSLNDDPDTMYSQFFTCSAGRNYVNLCDAKLDDLFNRQAMTLDREERRKIVWEMEKYVLQLAPTLMVRSTRPGFYAVSKQVRGWMPQRSEGDSMRYDTTWLAR